MLWFLIHEGGNNITQSGQRLIDIDGLLKSFSGGLCFLLPFGTSQIHQVELSHFDMLLSGGVVLTGLDR